MNSTGAIKSMFERYERAVRLTAPKLAAETPGISVEGYWLDESQFYFLAEKIMPSIGRLVSIPSIANLMTNSVEEVIPLEVLAGLLSGESCQSVDVKTLSTAKFDMPDQNTLAVSVGGLDYLVDRYQRRVMTAKASLEFSALYSPNGRYACFVKGFDLWLRERNTGIDRPLTIDGAAHYCYSQLSESGLSGVTYRKRPCPAGLWSPDSRWFLTHRIDERSLPELGLVENAPAGGGRPALHKFKYVMPGDPLPVATYVAIHVDSGRVVSFEGFSALVTMPWVLQPSAWFSGRDTVWFVRFDRYSRRAELVCLDLGQETGRVVFNESVTSGYIELHHLMMGTPNVRTLPGSGEIIWFSERDGWGHLYLYDAVTGRLKNRITSGEWMVRDIVHVDELRRRLLFLACGVDAQTDPARRSLCSVNLDGGGFEVLIAHDGDVCVSTTEPGGLGQDRPHRPSQTQAGISPGGRFAAVRYASVGCGNSTQIVELQTQRRFAIASATPGSDLVPPRRFIALAADGVTQLHGVMFFPSDFDESRRYPLIDYIYPGPQIAHQPQSFGSMLAALGSSLAELGFVTFMLDTRRMPFRSRALHQIGYGGLLEPQLADHAAVVRQLCERYSFIDGGRIGMIGQSGGGAATARTLFDYGEIFKVGVSVCGNHDSSVYTAPWADKYRGPDGSETWAQQSNGAAAHKLEGKLLLISGDMDENVHVSHTFSLVDALVRANRDFDLLIVPNGGHSVLMTSGYTQRRTWDYFVRNLLGEAPPKDFEIKFEPHELARCTDALMREFR
jgi:dipeptidyl-peptidase-4